jgi:hypothetical protein
MKLTVSEQVDERPVQAYGERPADIRIKRTFTLQAEVDEAAVQTETRSFGWRVYATECSASQSLLGTSSGSLSRGVSD